MVLIVKVQDLLLNGGRVLMGKVQDQFLNGGKVQELLMLGEMALICMLDDEWIPLLCFLLKDVKPHHFGIISIQGKSSDLQ